MSSARDGWQVFAPDAATQDWSVVARTAALAAVNAPEFAHWHQCEGTWFVGLDALANDAAGRVAGSLPLSGAAVDFATQHCGGWPALHRAQVSVVYPGYPRARAGESAAGLAYRRDRDAAHVDGVIGLGTPKRRFVQEPHRFILGVALSDASAEASPLVAWQGSHRIMQAAFEQALRGQRDASATDVTDIYVAARKRCFKDCARVPIPLPRAGAVVLHRLTLHGVAPWGPGASAGPDGRMIAYFRPPMPAAQDWWAGDSATGER